MAPEGPNLPEGWFRGSLDGRSHRLGIKAQLDGTEDIRTTLAVHAGECLWEEDAIISAPSDIEVLKSIQGADQGLLQACNSLQQVCEKMKQIKSDPRCIPFFFAFLSGIKHGVPPLACPSNPVPVKFPSHPKELPRMPRPKTGPDDIKDSLQFGAAVKQIIPPAFMGERGVEEIGKLISLFAHRSLSSFWDPSTKRFSPLPIDGSPSEAELRQGEYGIGSMFWGCSRLEQVRRNPNVQAIPLCTSLQAPGSPNCMEHPEYRVRVAVYALKDLPKGSRLTLALQPPVPPRAKGGNLAAMTTREAMMQTLKDLKEQKENHPLVQKMVREREAAEKGKGTTGVDRHVPWCRKPAPPGLAPKVFRLPGTPEGRVAFIVDGALSVNEASGLVNFSDDFDNVSAYTQLLYIGKQQNYRLIKDFPEVAKGIWERMKKVGEVPMQWDGRDASTLNPKLRFLRYERGDKFLVHTDGSYEYEKGSGPLAGHRSYVTVQVYLNAAYEGGATRFFVDGEVEVEEGSQEAKEHTAACRPDHPADAEEVWDGIFWYVNHEGRRVCDVHGRPGRLLVFEHDMLHEAAEISSGKKVIIRTEILYAPKE